VVSAPSYWLPPITEEDRTPHGCLNCEVAGAKPLTFPADGLIAVGFGYAGVTKDGLEVLGEPHDDEADWDSYPTGADAEKLAEADPDHDWRIHMEGPLSGRVYQRQADAGWVLVEQSEGFA
jgi:hypothetical protein